MPHSDPELFARARRLNDEWFGGMAAPSSVRWVDNQERRWASCTPHSRTIRLSRRLESMPRWVQDYVIVHELAHLLDQSHGPQFWAWVDRYPRAERAKGYLAGWSAAAELELPEGYDPD